MIIFNSLIKPELPYGKTSRYAKMEKNSQISDTGEAHTCLTHDAHAYGEETGPSHTCSHVTPSLSYAYHTSTCLQAYNGHDRPIGSARVNSWALYNGSGPILFIGPVESKEIQQPEPLNGSN